MKNPVCPVAMFPYAIQGDMGPDPGRDTSQRLFSNKDLEMCWENPVTVPHRTL